MNFRNICTSVLFLVCGISLNSCDNFFKKEEKKVSEVKVVKKPVFEKGFNLDKYTIIKDSIKSGEALAKILQDKNVPFGKIEEFVKKFGEYLYPKNIKAGDPYSLVYEKNNLDSLKYFIYEPDITYYLKAGIGENVWVEKVSKKVEIREIAVGGIINDNLSLDMMQAHVPMSAAYKFSQILEYTVDFFNLQVNDKFKIIYDEKFIDDTISAGIVDIKAAYMSYKGKDFYAFNFVTDSIKNVSGYYDENGNMMKRMFLKAPLDIFRITSTFGVRYHPILHRIKNHMGTDYAAPTGTPIRTTASGVVTQAGYKGGNGNFVKVRHNSIYETQYLHMSKILVRKGQRVSQGDIIGRVGSTGLATGPHVCYRFWKNGKQVNPLKEKTPNSMPIEKKLKNKYLKYIGPLKKQLDGIEAKESEREEDKIVPSDAIGGDKKNK